MQVKVEGRKGLTGICKKSEKISCRIIMMQSETKIAQFIQLGASHRSPNYAELVTCSQRLLSSSVRHARRRKAKAKERAVRAPIRAKPSDTSVGGRGAGAGVRAMSVEREGGGGAAAAFGTTTSG